MEPKQHVKILAYVHLGVGILTALVGLVALLVMAGIAVAVFVGEGDPTGAGVMGVIAIVAGVMFAVFAVPSIIAGAGLLKLKPWARVLAIVMGVLGLFSVPVGTAVGIYTLWVLLRSDVEHAFASGEWETQ